MNIHPAIIISLVICLMMLIWVIGKEYIIRILLRTVVGGCIIMGLNMILPSTFYIGLNVLTLAVAGILGIPGVGLLYIIQWKF